MGISKVLAVYLGLKQLGKSSVGMRGVEETLGLIGGVYFS